jgi:hypothetical protein
MQNCIVSSHDRTHKPKLFERPIHQPEELSKCSMSALAISQQLRILPGDIGVCEDISRILLKLPRIYR